MPNPNPHPPHNIPDNRSERDGRISPRDDLARKLWLFANSGFVIPHERRIIGDD